MLRVGRVTSGPAVEKLVTAALTSEMESLPEASWTAEFAAVASLVGAVYDTVTVFPIWIAVPMVSCTVLPDTTAALGWKSTPSIVTVYADAGAVREIIASSYERVSNVPVELTVADVNTGARKSGGTEELFVALTPVTDNMSLPVTSCNAALLGDESSAGAVYDTVTV